MVSEQLDGRLYQQLDPENEATDHEIRSDTMDAVRSCEFFGMPPKAAAEELELLANALREDGYDILGGELDVE